MLALPEVAPLAGVADVLALAGVDDVLPLAGVDDVLPLEQPARARAEARLAAARARR
jgi:hypothetical protein